MVSTCRASSGLSNQCKCTSLHFNKMKTAGGFRQPAFLVLRWGYVGPRVNTWLLWNDCCLGHNLFTEYRYNFVFRSFCINVGCDGSKNTRSRDSVAHVSCLRCWLHLFWVFISSLKRYCLYSLRAVQFHLWVEFAVGSARLAVRIFL